MPSAICPAALSPQHQTLLSPRRAQVNRDAGPETSEETPSSSASVHGSEGMGVDEAETEVEELDAEPAEALEAAAAGVTTASVCLDCQ